MKMFILQRMLEGRCNMSKFVNFKKYLIIVGMIVIQGFI